LKSAAWVVALGALPCVLALVLGQGVLGASWAHPSQPYLYLYILVQQGLLAAGVALLAGGYFLYLRPAHRVARQTMSDLRQAGQQCDCQLHELRAAYGRTRDGLQAAAQIQRSLLPVRAPQYPGVQFAWAFEPCEELGGDMFDVVALDEDHLGVYVLDVSGHGAQAALLAVSLSRALRAGGLLRRPVARPPGYELMAPAEVARELHRLFPWMAETSQFFTLCYGILNTRTREFVYTRAGQAGPLLLTRHRVTRHDQGGGPPIGAAAATTYPEFTLRLQPGERLFLLSDGVEEVADPSGERYGLERVCRLLADYRRETLSATVLGLRTALEEFSASAPRRDDITILALEVGLADTADPDHLLAAFGPPALREKETDPC
jgi:sigma-B regulation protein RsbU (phosphoserine phosphatase)